MTRVYLGLEIVAKIIDTEAVLIANPHTTHMNVIELIKRRLLGTKMVWHVHLHALNATHYDAFSIV